MTVQGTKASWDKVISFWFWNIPTSAHQCNAFQPNSLCKHSFFLGILLDKHFSPSINYSSEVFLISRCLKFHITGEHTTECLLLLSGRMNFTHTIDIIMHTLTLMLVMVSHVFPLEKIQHPEFGVYHCFNQSLHVEVSLNNKLFAMLHPPLAI